jgi:lysophospholipase L1-like esterase
MTTQETVIPPEFLEYVVRLAGDPTLSFEPLVVPLRKADELLAASLGAEADQLEEIRADLQTRVGESADQLLKDDDFARNWAAVPTGEWSTTVVVGDSCSADILSWANILGALLQRTHPDVRFVNRAVSGRTTGETIANAGGLVAAKPETVVLLLGANDIRRHGTSANVRMATIEETTRNFRELRRLIQLETGAQVIAVAPAPLGITAVDTMREQGTWFLPEEIADVVEAFTSIFPDAIQLNHAPDGLGADFWSFDQVHPTLEGHIAILRVVVEALADRAKN